MLKRRLVELTQARATSDGAGVNLHRIFGGPGPERFDPFLMMDDFGSDNPNDYIAGFPPHPHRGFRTVTYMLEGSFEHKDHMGHVGAIGAGGVQWMNAGSGVIHSEMPIQKTGKVRGFQLWLNLPAKDKMMTPSYENLEAEQIASFKLEGLKIKAIVGSTQVNGEPIQAYKQIAETQPLYLDLLNSGESSTQIQVPIEQGHTLLVYVAEGCVELEERSAQQRQLLRFSDSGELQLELKPHSRIIILSGQPLKEPIVQHGPFVMNSYQEIEQAIRDYQNGTLTEAEAQLG